MKYEEAKTALEKAGATALGNTLTAALAEHPGYFKGDFVPTAGKRQPHFQTTGPMGGTWYLRLDHRGEGKIVFGSDE